MARATNARLIAAMYHTPAVGSTRCIRDAQDGGKAIAHESMYAVSLLLSCLREICVLMVCGFALCLQRRIINAEYIYRAPWH